jgi:hypothetical protein
VTTIRTRLTLVAVVAVAAAAMIIPSTANAIPSCSPFSVPAPTLGGGIHLESDASCSAKWQYDWTLQAEVGGSWTSQAHGYFPADGTAQACPSGIVGTHHPRCYAAGSRHDDRWTATANVQPYCAFNWRVQIAYDSYQSDGTANSSQFVSSPQLNKTC